MVAGLAGGDEDAGADHAADAEADEVEPAKGSAHVGAGAGSGLAHFFEGCGHRGGAAAEAAGRVG